MKIGLLGCSNISTTSILTPAKTNPGVEVYAVTCRDQDRGAAYADKYEIPLCFPTYSEMLESDQLDSVYIALPPALQCDYAVKAFNHGKHVLIEKPMCLTLKDFNRLEEAASNSHCYLLEGIMIQFHPWQAAVKELVESQKFGPLKRIHTDILVQLPDQLRSGYRSCLKLGGGVFIDEAPYWLQFLQSVIGLEADNCQLEVEEMKNGVDDTVIAKATINSVPVSFHTSHSKKYAASHTLYFEKATVSIKDFFRAAMGKYKIRLHIESGAEQRSILFEPQSYYENQLRYFGEIGQHGYHQGKQMVQMKKRVEVLEKFIQILNRKRSERSI